MNTKGTSTMSRMTPVTALSVMMGALCGTAHGAVFHAVDFSAYHNAVMQNRFGAFGTAPTGDVVLGGVPFHIPTSGNNEWTRGESFNHNGETTILDIPVGQYGMRKVFTLINSYWGTAFGGLMKIECFGSGGSYFAKDLVGNNDIRDWNLYPGFTTLINGTTTQNVFTISPGRDGTPDVIDMQGIDLPPEFATQALTSIRITDLRLVGIHSGIVSGITVSDIPAPGSLALLSLSGLVALRRRR